MKKYEITYNNRYYEIKLWQKEIIVANSKKEALKKFAKFFNISDYNKLFNPLFMWENGCYLSTFQSINKIKQ